MFLWWLLFPSVVSGSWQETASNSDGSTKRRSEREWTRVVRARKAFTTLSLQGPRSKSYIRARRVGPLVRATWQELQATKGRHTLTSLSLPFPRSLASTSIEARWQVAQGMWITEVSHPGHRHKTSFLGWGQTKNNQCSCCSFFPSPPQGLNILKIGILTLQGLFKTHTEEVASGPLVLFWILSLSWDRWAIRRWLLPVLSKTESVIQLLHSHSPFVFISRSMSFETTLLS